MKSFIHYVKSSPEYQSTISTTPSHCQLNNSRPTRGIVGNPIGYENKYACQEASEPATDHDSDIYRLVVTWPLIDSPVKTKINLKNTTSFI